MAEPVLLALGIGCTLLTVDTRLDIEGDTVIEQVRAEVRSEGSCTAIDVVLPAGVRLSERAARTHLSDDTGHRLGDGRWEVVPRDVDGVGHQVLHVPELLGGDEVRLDLERRWRARDYRWAPGVDGARWAEIRLPFDATTVITGELQGSGRKRWVATPTPVDGVFIAGGALAEGDAQPAGTDTPAEAVATVSGWTLLPDRPDLEPILVDPEAIGAATAAQVATALVARTAASPTPLTRGLILPAGAPVAPGQRLAPVAATHDGDVARLWTHPDQRWSPDWRVLMSGAVLEPVAAPAGDGPRADAPADLRRSLELRLPKGSDPNVDLVPGRRSTAVQTDLWRLPGPDRARLRAVPVPTGAVVLEASVTGGPNSSARVSGTGDQILLLAARGETPEFTVALELPDAPTCGQEPSLPGVAVSGFAVRGDGAQVRQDDGWWWVERWNDAPLLTERARVVAGLHGRFNRRSIPEPGLPVRLRSRLDGWGLAAEMAGALRERAKVEPLPGDPRWPRQIMRARRSGVVTPVEAALILRAYALQSKLEADWALVRPASEGPGHTLCPVGYDVGLLRIIHEGETRWIDPGCAACSPFEVRPDLLGASAIGPWVDGTPEPPPGSSRIVVEAGTRVTWTLTGPAALELRLWLETRPSDGRSELLAARIAGAGARLVSATGVGDAGADIVIVADAADARSLPPPDEVLLPAPRPDGGLFLSWIGPRSYRWSDEGSAPVEVSVASTGRHLPADLVPGVRASLQRPAEAKPTVEVEDGPGEATPE
jgi:hypothetical protein